MSEVLKLTENLIRRVSLTPEDAGCQKMLADRLLPLGCEVEWLYAEDVTNVIISHGQGSPRICFVGHTDVVPTGPVEDWSSPPFDPVIRNGKLYGRGTADMKGAVAAMTIAMQRYIEEFPDHPGTISLVITSDEEGPSTHGVRLIADLFKKRDQIPDYCIVGEPSSLDRLGDNIRIGRRGSINVKLTAHGVQGHTAYSDRGINPVHQLAPFLTALIKHQWDQGNDDFPPTSLQISNIKAGTGATNVTPGHAEVQFNIRNSPVRHAKAIEEGIHRLLKLHGIEKYDMEFKVNGEPFYTPAGRLSDAATKAIERVLSIETRLDTGGGTSDGRFIAPLGTQVVEVGPVNMSIHKVDEHVNVADLDHLMVIYFEMLRELHS